MSANVGKINTSKLKSTTKPQIKTAKTSLFNARNQLIGISMPSNFQYSSLLNTTIPDRIKKIENNMEEINSFIDNKIGAAINKEKKDNDLANSLASSILLQSNIGSTLNSAFSSNISKMVEGTMLSVAQSAAVVKSKQTSQNWIGLRLGNKNYGFYVDKDGNVVKNSNINGVEFGKNGKAVDETQFNMMIRAVNKEVPKGTYTDFGNNIPINQNVRVLVDDNDSKYGILVKNEKKEWEFLYYGNCISGRNPAVRSREGEYLTCGKYKGQGFNEKYPYFELEPSKEDPRAEVRTFLLSYI